MENFCYRGKDTRIRLVNEYVIKPISHMPLLKRQKKRSVAKDIITKEYYCFSYKRRNSNDACESFIVGLHAAKYFLELLKQPSIPIFDIIKLFNERSNVGKCMSPSLVTVELFKNKDSTKNYITGVSNAQ